MDISVLVSVGSFVVSERVLKPKATFLVCLGCLLAYDLTTKTHDVSSLRVYRGPGLLAFTLMMVAYSLRTWRRNGIACDELLFLPGTAHGDVTVSGSISQSPSLRRPNRQPAQSEGDVAAGGWATGGTNIEMTATVPQLHTIEPVTPSRNLARTISNDSSLSSIQEFANTWDEDTSTRRDEEEAEDSADEVDEEMAPLKDETRGASNRSSRPSERMNSTVSSDHSVPSMADSSHSHTRAERFRENHPRITRIGSFFFFRSSTSNTSNAAYAPSAPTVMGAALDLFMPVLLNFHLFIEAWNHLDAYDTEAPAKILPLIFLTVLIGRTIFPPGRRGRFWATMKCTASAPFHPSLLRDAFVGDVLTSLVRPLQDVFFALAYYVTVVWGTLSTKYDLSDSGEILETSWLLHNVILRAVALTPLWWKFLQTLRESFDNGKRWPYLGNAFKYLTAALVILYGMAHPEERHSTGWILAFTASLVYQIFWDTVMDWDLFVIAPKESEGLDVSESSVWLSGRISSVRPGSYWLLALQRACLPVRQFVRSTIARIPSYKQIQLRPQRLYKTEMFYWKIFAFNSIFRCCWMLSIIPSYHLSDKEDAASSFSSDTKSYMGVLLPITEICRRTLWGFLFLEMQTIRMVDGNPSVYTYAKVGTVVGDQEDEMEISTESVDSSKPVSKHYLPPWLGTQQQLQHEAATTTSPWNIATFFRCDKTKQLQLFLAELALWAAAFVALGIWVLSL